MKGMIAIEGLRISCIIGIFPEEREKEQELILDLELETDFSALVWEQNIAETVDYFELSNWLENWIHERKFLLLESLAEQACLAIFQRYPLVEQVQFTVRKPAAIPKATAAKIQITRSRVLD